MDDNDELPPEPTDQPGGSAVRIRALNGWTIIVRTDPETRLITLDSEDPDGVLVASRVLGTDDVQKLVDALGVASAQAKKSDGPVVLDVSKVIGRD